MNIVATIADGSGVKICWNQETCTADSVDHLAWNGSISFTWKMIVQDVITGSMKINLMNYFKSCPMSVQKCFTRTAVWWWKN